MNGKLYAAAAVLVMLCAGDVAVSMSKDCEDFSHCWAEQLHWQGRKLLLKPQMTAGECQRAIVKLKTAAELIGPDNTSASIYKDLYQLLDQVSGRREALDALLRYVQMQNQDALASQQWLAWQLDQANTIEQRMALLEGFIAKETTQPEEALSDAYRQLGELQYQKFDAAGARSSLKKAIELVDVNLAAWEQLLAISQQSGPEHSEDEKGEKGKADVISRLIFQVGYLQAQIRANPADIDACRQLARLLDDISLHQQAQVYYKHAIDSYRQLANGQACPVGLMLDYASSLFEAGKLIQARKIFVELIDNVSDSHSEQAQSSSAPASRPASTWTCPACRRR